MTPDADTSEADHSPSARLPWMFAGVWATLIVASSVGLWRARQYNVDHGIPCESRGTWGCGFLEPPAYAAWAAILALPFVVVAAIIWFVVGRAWPRVAAAIVAVAFVAWIALSMSLPSTPPSMSSESRG